MNVVARDVVDCLEVFVPLPGALSTVEPATRVHAVNSFDVRLLAVAFTFSFFLSLAFLFCFPFSSGNFLALGSFLLFSFAFTFSPIQAGHRGPRTLSRLGQAL